MIKRYLIDGNNLIWKIPRLAKLQKSNKQAARDHLIPKLDGKFVTSRTAVTVYFDGFPDGELRSSKVKIKYSNNRPADRLIIEEIERSKNPRTICVVSSDHEIQNLAKVCGAKIIKSEEFFNDKSNEQIEDEKPKGKIGDVDEWMRLFNG
ncbi:MAG: NYN domain-containing protein [Chlorobi bacterium]|nr:NYN domain-containing protein [Chlorobiota bacterium]